MSDTLTRVGVEIADRIATLKPAVDETSRLESALTALLTVSAPSTAAPVKRVRLPQRSRKSIGATAIENKKLPTIYFRDKSPQRSRISRSIGTTSIKNKKLPAKRSNSKKAGRQLGSGKRREEVLNTLGKVKKGLTVNELAARLKIKPNYLYRVLYALNKEGKISQDDKSKKWTLR